MFFSAFIVGVVVVVRHFQICDGFTCDPFFQHWHCIGIKEFIDSTKPFKVQIGELPLVLWKGKSQWHTTLNVCKHMGAQLDNGIVTHNGCLKCTYHGLEMTPQDQFGQVKEHEGKIFWAYEPHRKTPFHTPFFENKQFETSFLQIDMDASLRDSAFNTMDLRHPEYVHQGGFGSNIPATKVKHYRFRESVGLGFEYESNTMMKTVNEQTRITHNFNMYYYPSFVWTRVTFKEKQLIIAVNFLPLEPKKTRWFITICHNYYKTPMGKNMMKGLASLILSQDFFQLKNQYPENALKSAILFGHAYEDEDALLLLYEQFKEYQFPTIEKSLELFKDSRRKKAK